MTLSGRLLLSRKSQIAKTNSSQLERSANTTVHIGNLFLGGYLGNSPLKFRGGINYARIDRTLVLAGIVLFRLPAPPSAKPSHDSSSCLTTTALRCRGTCPRTWPICTIRQHRGHCRLPHTDHHHHRDRVMPFDDTCIYTLGVCPNLHLLHFLSGVHAWPTGRSGKHTSCPRLRH